MASVFEFDTTETLAKTAYAKSAPAVAKMKAALLKKKIAPDHVDKFIEAYGKAKVTDAVQAAQEYIQKNMFAKKLAPVTQDPNVLQKAFMVALFGPQKKILQASFDLSVHLKGTTLELQHTTCKGEKKVLVSVPKP